MSHRNRASIIVAVVVAVSGLKASAGIAGPRQVATTPEGGIYRLDPGSAFQQGCFPPCLCPIQETSGVRGTFKLTYKGNDSGIDVFAVDDVNFTVPNNEGGLRIIGGGVYRVGSPDATTVLKHRLELDVRVGADAVHLDSGWVVLDALGRINIAVSANGMVCLDTVIIIDAGLVLPDEILHYRLVAGSTFQRGCWDPCDCLLGQTIPVAGTFDLVRLEANSFFTEFAVVNASWNVLSDTASEALPVRGFGVYHRRAEVATLHRLSMELTVGAEPQAHYGSGLVVATAPFPRIDILISMHGLECFDTAFHVVADPADGEVCGGIAGIPCREGEFCKLPVGQCCCDHFGVCTPMGSGACPAVWAPVCGCDGVTYGNECESDAAGVSIAHYGECQRRCGDPNQYPPCNDGEFCKWPEGTCGDPTVPGVCTAIPPNCPDVWDPVCGCDGVTYGNMCEADAVGMSIAHRGPCEPACEVTSDGGCSQVACSDIPEEQCLATVLHLDVQTGAITALACECLNFNLCHIEFGNASPFPVGECPDGGTCEVIASDTDNDGIDDEFRAACRAIGACCTDIGGSPLPVPACSQTTQRVCESGGGFFAGVGTSCEQVEACCLPMAGEITCLDLNPACCRAFDGVPQGPDTTCSDATQVDCPNVCGGIAGLPCADGQFCKFPDGTCGEADILGVCTQIPTGGCPEYYDPVCGCDGVTYGNVCEANAAGVSVAHDGECTPSPCEAVRIFPDSDFSYCNGLAKSVTIELTPPAGVTAIAIEDSPPPGWEVLNISHEGSFDAANGKVKWGPFFAPFPARVSYDVMPMNTTGPVCFEGVVSLDGVNRPVCGESCLDVCCPRMDADQPQPPCADCPESDCRACAVCGDGRLALCEMIGYACAWMRGCNDNLADMTRAAFIWRSGECYCWEDADQTWWPAPCDWAGGSSGCCSAPASVTTAGGAGYTARIIVSRIKRAPFSPLGSTIPWGMEEMIVPIQIEAPSGTAAMALEVVVPPGWRVTDVSDGGAWDLQHGKIKWGPFMDRTSRTVTFRARGLSGSVTGKVRRLRHAGRQQAAAGTRQLFGFSGTVSFDGINHPIAIE